MKTWQMTALALFAVVIFGGGCSGIYFVGTMNKSIGLINTIKAKQVDNTNEFDTMAKKISQTAQVSEKQLAALKDIFVSHAQARTTDGGGLMKWVQESCPTVDVKTMENLQNIVVASRDRWCARQKELIDLKREHDNLVDMFPSSLILAVCGHQKQDIIVVTSGRAKEAFATGEDNETTLFKD
jgi:hypothetical protein